MIGSDKLDYSFGLLDDILALGGNTFDAAHVYGNGDNERTLGRWIEDRGVRDQVVIITKGAHHNQDRPRVTPFDITADLHDSLARLRTDYIDLYLLHRDDPRPAGRPDCRSAQRASGRRAHPRLWRLQLEPSPHR
jgi:aryl-alcohol dehydrogenase-like predicted oxidoreductase